MKFESYDNIFNHIKERYTTVEFECVWCATYFISQQQFDEHNCAKTFDLEEIYMSLSEWREIQRMMEENIEN